MIFMLTTDSFDMHSIVSHHASVIIFHTLCRNRITLFCVFLLLNRVITHLEDREKSELQGKWEKSGETIISFCRPSTANTLNKEMEF